MPNKTITFRISEEEHRDLKLAAFQTGRTLKDLLMEAVREVRQRYEAEIEAAQKKGK